MKKYAIFFTKRAVKDFRLLSGKMQDKLKTILNEVISEKPYSGKRLSGEMKGDFSYRLSVHDRIVYRIDEDKKTVYIKRA